jgi:hypothetical protein
MGSQVDWTLKLSLGTLFENSFTLIRDNRMSIVQKLPCLPLWLFSLKYHVIACLAGTFSFIRKTSSAKEASNDVIHHLYTATQRYNDVIEASNSNSISPSNA